VQRTLERSQGDDLPGARDSGHAPGVHPLHGPLAGALRRPYQRECPQPPGRHMNGLNYDYTVFIPEFMLIAVAAIVVALDLFVPQVRKSWLPYVAAAGLIATG